MNLCIDIGNTRTKAAVFYGDELMDYFPELSPKVLNGLFEEYRSLHVMIAQSGSDHDVQAILEQKQAWNVLGHRTDIPIEFDYKTPETLGSDRLAAAIGANQLYPRENVAIIDLGTCLTLDLVDANGIYQGGLISPGIDMRLKAMNEYTSGLPLVNFNDKITYPGKSTEESMQVGVLQSLRYEIIGCLNHMAAQYEQLKVVDCSGYPLNFDKVPNYKIFAHPKLVLYGLNVIANQNAK